jgi:hypothetical protein
MSIEKRKEHRLRANVPIKVKLNAGQEFIGRTQNISRLGTYVEADKEVRSGIIVSVTLELPGDTEKFSSIEEVKCFGTVFRCNLLRETAGQKIYGIGIFFTEFANSSDREKLSGYVDYLIQKEEQDVKEGVRRRREKEELEKGARHSTDIQNKQEEFQKETLQLLKDITAQLNDIQRMLAADKKVQ